MSIKLYLLQKKIILLYQIRRILIANRGLSTTKFVLSLKQFYRVNDNNGNEIKFILIGMIAPLDISCNYSYISQLDELIRSDDDNIFDYY